MALESALLIIPKAVASWFVGKFMTRLEKAIANFRKDEKLEADIAEAISAAIKIASPRDGALGSTSLADDIIYEASDIIINYVFRGEARIDKTGIFDDTRLRLANKYSIPKEGDVLDKVYSITKQDFESFFDRFLTALDEQLWQKDSLVQYHRDGALRSIIQTTSVTLDEAKETRQIAQATHEKLTKISDNLANASFNQTELDTQLETQLSVIRQSRFFHGVDHKNSVTRLAHDLLDGRMSNASSNCRGKALSWCARFLFKIDIDGAKKCLAAIPIDYSGDEVEVAAAFIDAEGGDVSKALTALSAKSTPLANTAALQIKRNDTSAKEALQWLADAGLSFEAFDSDGKFLVLAFHMETGGWETAWALADTITEDDFTASPCLLFVRSSLCLAKALPAEARAVVSGSVPINAQQLRFSDTQEAIESRALAIQYFDRCAAAATALNCLAAASVAKEFSYWVKLSDPAAKEAAQQGLIEELEQNNDLRLAPLALEYGLPINTDELERRMDAATARSGRAPPEVTSARFKLALRQKSPSESAQYIERYFDDFLACFDPQVIYPTLVDMHLLAGSPEAAKERFDQWRQSDNPPSPPLETHFSARFAGTEPTNDTDQALQFYNETGDLSGLLALNALLASEADWDRLSLYAPKAFELTKSVSDAELVATAYLLTGAYRKMISFFDASPIPHDRTQQLYSFYGWSRLYNGDFKSALSVSNELQSQRDDENDRQLEINTLIASGDWDGLLGVINRDWGAKSSKTGAELLQLGTLAFTLRDPRAKTIVREAANQSKDNAHILAGAYLAASNNGWEDEDEVAEWFKLAAEKSDPETGPFKSYKLADIPKIDPGWNDRVEKTLRQLRDLEIPMALGAKVRNQTLLEQTLLPAIANTESNDLRFQSPIFAYSGHRPPSIIGEARIVMLDPISLITLLRLGLLDNTIERFEKVLIPHSTMGWLFAEQQRLQQLQLSQVTRAENLVRLVQKGHLTVWEKEPRKISSLATEVDAELAAMLIATKSEDAESFVVRSGPVHRIGSLMEEAADLSEYYDVLVSCSAVIEKLFDLGAITEHDRIKCLADLSRKEQDWPQPPSIPDGALLYLDGLSVNYLYDNGVLTNLSSSGLTAIVSRSTLDEAHAWIKRKSLLDALERNIKTIRQTVQGHIESGDLTCAPALDLNEDDPIEEPTPYIDAVLSDVPDISVTDDRYFNVQMQVQHKDKVTPLASSLDILLDLHKAGLIDQQAYFQKLQTLRRERFCLIPITDDELLAYIRKAPLRDEKLRETAEMKEIKAYLQFIRMDDLLRPQSQQSWLLNQIQAFVRTIRRVWELEEDFDIAGKRSDWLIATLNNDSWARFLPPERPDLERVTTLREIVIASLFLLPPFAGNRREAFFTWMENSFLNGIDRSDSELLESLANDAKNVLFKLLQEIEKSS